MNQKMLNVSALLCAFILLVPVSSTDNNSINCDTDRDCPTTMFCYNDACAPCFNCSTHFRQNRLRCSKEPSDCGKCLPGYQEDSYRKSHYHWCRPELMAQPRVGLTDNLDETKFKFSFPSIAMFVIACVFVLGFMSYYCYNNNRHHDSWTTDVQANYQFSNHPPPPYKEEDIPMNDRINSIPSSFHLEVNGRSEDNLQKAVPFLYVENSTSRIENGETNGTIQIVQASSPLNSETAFTAINFDIHDETTVPSAWTPGSSYGETVDGKNETESPPKKRKKSGPGEEEVGDKK